MCVLTIENLSYERSASVVNHLTISTTLRLINKGYLTSTSDKNVLVHFSWEKIFDYVKLLFCDFKLAFLTSSYFCGFHSKMMFSKSTFHDIMRTRPKIEV